MPVTRSKVPFYGCVGMVGLSLVAAVVGRLTHVEAPQTGSVIASRDLQFLDNLDGSVLVRSAQDQQTVEVLTGENGFVRGTMRGLARNRRADNIGADAPFRLTAWSDGRLTLTDLSNDRRVELEAFGSENVAVFAHMLNLSLQPGVN